MQIVQRILNKVIGEEISAEQLEEVAGGLKDMCEGGWNTWSGGVPYSGGWEGCDN
jgi:hypothetical protein